MSRDSIGLIGAMFAFCGFLMTPSGNLYITGIPIIAGIVLMKLADLTETKG